MLKQQSAAGEPMVNSQSLMTFSRASYVIAMPIS